MRGEIVQLEPRTRGPKMSVRERVTVLKLLRKHDPSIKRLRFEYAKDGLLSAIEVVRDAGPKGELPLD